MDAGTWLCPHCYEDEHPEEGWMCNSSICMKRRGYKPTGIAIYDAQQRGFPSVAHWLQAQLRKRGSSSGKAAAAGEKEGAEAGIVADKLQSQADSSSGSAAAGAAAAEVESSKRSSRAAVSGSSKASSSSASGDVQAPGTPVRDAAGSAGGDSAAVAAEPAAAGGRGGRVTRRGAAAAAAAGFETEQEQSSKRACIGENAGTRRSLRFKSK
jgi:hypothetical protein